MSAERDAYAVLQVHPEADLDVIQAAYRALARQYHPDGSTPDIDRMREVNGAYERIKTEAARREYDAQRRVGVAVGPGRPETRSNATWNPQPAGRPGAFRRALADDSPTLDFGRYEGWRISEIARHDPDYLRWLSRHSTGIRFRDVIARCLPGERDLGRRASILG